MIHVRNHTTDVSTWGVRHLEYAARNDGIVTGFPLAHLLKKLFAILAPGRPLPEQTVSTGEQRQNWGIDRAYLTAEGDGIVISEYCGGAVAGETVDAVYTLFVVDVVNVTVSQALDYPQSTLEFSISAPPEWIDVAGDALVKVAANAGLVLIGRE